MKNQSHTVSSHFARAYLEGAFRLGLDPDYLLQKSMLNRDIIDSPNSQLRITSEQLSRLALEVWTESDDELFGFSNYPIKVGVFQLFAKYSVHCHTLREVYQYSCDFYNLVNKAFQLEFVEEGDHASLYIFLSNPELDTEYTIRELLTLVWHRYPSWLIGRKIPLISIDFDFSEPPHASEYRLMYPCKILFGQKNSRLLIASEALDEEVIQTPSSLGKYLNRVPFDWFKQQNYHPVYTREVLNLLNQYKQNGDINMEMVAEQLNMTSRTLRRKLQDEGTRFQTLKDNVRRDAAVHLLSQTALTIGEIASHLGFSDPVAFTRAFKTWTGVPPSLYRRK